MANNEFLSIKNIARQTLPRLIENLTFPMLCHRDYSGTYEVGKGATIQVRKPVILSASEFDESTGITAQDVKEQSVEVTLDKLATVDVEFSAVQRATNVDDLNRLFVEPAAVALAEKINRDGLALYKDIPYSCGTVGTTPSDLADFANAAKVLDDNKVPNVMRRAVWDAASLSKFRQVKDIVNANKSGTTEALRAGNIGTVFGIDNYMSQGVHSATAGNLVAGGTGATGLKVKTAVSTADNKFVVISNATASATLTGATVVGDIVVVNGKKYVVVEAKTAASNEVEVVINEKITVLANAAVTITSGGAQNLVFHENAFAFVTRPLSTPAGVESFVTNYNGLSLRVTRGYNMQYKKEMLSCDILYGYKTMYPELACRVLG